MKIQFLGSGDAFGSGGRMQTCIYAHHQEIHFLIDCGTSAMIGIRKFGIDPNRISHIFLSHLHGDHFGGIPFFLVDAQLISKREAPLAIVGPVGTKERILNLMEIFFPGSSKVQQKYALEFVELNAVQDYQWMEMKQDRLLVHHPSGAEATALRICWEDKKMVYTGDTEWVDSLSEFIMDVDLLIAESYYFDRQVRFHLDYKTIIEKAQEARTKRIILTHMSEEMLTHLTEIQCEFATDGSEFYLDE